jgi:hypothetical protein
MNDDFLYTRQESPEPEFVMQLQARLEQVDIPRKSKRKNEQRFYSWRGIAALFALTVASLVLIIFSQARLRASVINIFVDDPNYDMLADLYSLYRFELPTAPIGYKVSTIAQTSMADELGRYNVGIHWLSSDRSCIVVLTADFSSYKYVQGDNENPPIEGVLAENEVLLNDRVVGVLGDPIGASRLRYRMSWRSENGIFYTLNALKSCISMDEFLVIAQSTLSNSP